MCSWFNPDNTDELEKHTDIVQTPPKVQKTTKVPTPSKPEETQEPKKQTVTSDIPQDLTGKQFF